MTLDEFIAVEVMELVPGETEYQWNDKDGNRIFDGRKFEPTTNIEQAFMALKSLKMEGLSFRWLVTNHSNEGHVCYVAAPISSGWDIGAEHESLPMAISLAVARAKRWEE